MIYEYRQYKKFEFCFIYFVVEVLLLWQTL